ncbi:MAG: hypothetical protein RIB45_16070 [Marivibrio sp.]|uniref:hypothetical protein n=1 Tax=Marivibrio sp. TaxID=2039719 RepID=UPI0032ED72AE
MADAIADIGARPDLLQTLRAAAQGPQAPLAEALSSLRAPPPAVAADLPPFAAEPVGAPAAAQLFEPLSLRAAAVPAPAAEATPGFPLSVASQDFAALIEGAGRDQATADQIAGAFLDASALV